jgi:adenylate cyclase
MEENLKELNREREKEGKRPFSHGIGIHTGEVLAGNTGSEDQPSYALIGDTVNLASRLQGLNKEFGTTVIISEATQTRLNDTLPVTPLPAARVKGITRPVGIFTLE